MYDADVGPKFIEFMPGIKDKQQSRKAKKFMCNFKLDGVVKTRDAPMVCQTLNGVFVEASSAQLAIEENSLCSFHQLDNGKDMPDFTRIYAVKFLVETWRSGRLEGVTKNGVKARCRWPKSKWYRMLKTR